MITVPRVTGVYLIRHRSSGREYIGSSRNVRARIQEHLSALRKGLHRSTILQDDFDRDGAEDFDVALLAISDLSYARELEARYLVAYARAETHYNTRVVPGLKDLRGAERRAEMARRNGREHRHHTEATKRRIGEAGRGKVNSPETRERMSNAQKARFALAPLPDEAKERIRMSLTGRVQSAATRAKRSASLKASWARRKEAV